MKQLAVEWLENQIKTSKYFYKLMEDINSRSTIAPSNIFKQAKEKEENIHLEIVHKFAFDYIYNYRGDKTIYEYVDEWFKEYKRLEEK